MELRIITASNLVKKRRLSARARRWAGRRSLFLVYDPDSAMREQLSLRPFVLVLEVAEVLQTVG